MNYVYSASKNSFFPTSMKGVYAAAGSWPADGVEIEDEVFIEFALSTPNGKVRIVGDNGLPAWGDIPLPTRDEVIAIAELDRKNLINDANDYIGSRQWPGKASLGRLKGNDLTQYGLWLDYLDALESFDTSSAPDIVWPESPK
ncbi:tail fiber assembly protein [uncultured Pantoea sp.]|uniref:tail fiber assembly protein n=1 Tax=uncultured Pantoea sp. TaxID=218084 RepID=UPI0025F006FE|nr:tail fiber assembly protein [uncultured Pantoea sp.]